MNKRDGVIVEEANVGMEEAIKEENDNVKNRNNYKSNSNYTFNN
jgi:hypothetical protein